jgi:hypothetical protein
VSTFKCNYDQLRSLAAEFIAAASIETDLQALAAGLRCVQLHYLACEYVLELEEESVLALVRVVDHEYVNAQLRIMKR